jgi:hypothetical protein
MNKVESLIYQHAPLLLEQAPEATAHLILRLFIVGLFCYICIFYYLYDSLHFCVGLDFVTPSRCYFSKVNIIIILRVGLKDEVLGDDFAGTGVGVSYRLGSRNTGGMGVYTYTYLCIRISICVYVLKG